MCRYIVNKNDRKCDFAKFILSKDELIEMRVPTSCLNKEIEQINGNQKELYEGLNDFLDAQGYQIHK